MKVGELFDIISQRFAPDEKAMGLFVKSCFEKDEFKGKAVLDAGCGSGIAGMYFAKNGAGKVTGVDISEKCILFARRHALSERIRNIDFLQADLSDLPFEDGTFDIVFSVGALPYIEDIDRSMRELARVLTEDGTILILSLKKTGWGGIFEMARRIFASMPSRYILVSSKVLAVLAKPVSPLILKRSERKDGKTLQQTVIEAFFSPVRLRKYSHDEIGRRLAREGVGAIKLMPPYLNFCSPSTVFIVKGKKRKL